MYVKAINKIQESIFPIFYKLVEGERTSMGVTGTGFFINNKGHFLTAHHVVKSIPQGATLFYAGNVPHNIIQPVNITEIFSDPIKDVFIGKIDEGALPPVELIFEKSEIGKSICLCGYTMAQLSLDPNGAINLNNVRKYWQPTFVIDNITAELDGRKYVGFMTQDASLKGMSGGPVFDIEGKVCAMDVASTTRKIPDEHVPQLITNGIVVELFTIKEILDNI